MRPSFRVVNAESDFLSGPHRGQIRGRAGGADFDRSAWTSAKAKSSPRCKTFSRRAAILERGDMATRKFEGLGENRRRIVRRIQRTHFSEPERTEI